MVTETEDTRLVYSVTEIAKLLHISRNLAYRSCREQRIPGVIFLGRRRMVVSASAINKLLAEGSDPLKERGDDNQNG